jgi:hypothetical protein
MKKIPLLLSFVALILAACSPEYIPTPPTYVPANTPVPLSANIPLPSNPPLSTSMPFGTLTVPRSLTPIQQAAVSLLSFTLNLPAGQIKLLSSQAVTWPDGCLGVQRIGFLCADGQVQGFVIMLEANGKHYEFHTNADGSQIVPAAGVQASDPAQDAVRKHLASVLGIDAGQITVVSDAELEWPDSCLGVAQDGVACAEIVTSGHLIMLEANNLDYEYHTNGDGSKVQPTTLALTWTRNGGIAGFCDSLTVYLAGEVSVNTCKGKPLNANVSSAELQQLETWVAQFGQLSLDASDPLGVSDRMTRQLSVFGNGSAQPTSADQQVLFQWAEDLHQSLYK